MRAISLWAVPAVCLAVVLSIMGRAEAMQIHKLTLSEVLGKTAVAFVARIDEVSSSRGDFFTEITLHAKPIAPVIGSLPASEDVTCTYRQAHPPWELPERNGVRIIITRVTGSGMERNLSAGQEVVLLLAAPGEEAVPGACEFLRAEPVSAQTTIRAEYESLKKK